jgi:hypothetical protein
MPALTFLAVVGLVLIGLLFVADATLENGPPPIVTSERTGLPKPWRPDGAKALTTAPAPAPDMTSQAVLSAQPKAVHDTSAARVSAAARVARAESLPRNTRFTAPAVYPQNSNLFDRFSIKGQ